MVNVATKSVTQRYAVAQCAIRLPKAVWTAFRDADIMAPKGPVLATATVAGIIGAKKTSELVPMCHPIPLEHCSIHFDLDRSDGALGVECEARTHAKTGIEMEALNGVSAAALCIYDMCKALSTDIVITDLHLVAKSGGKRDFDRRTL